MSEDLETLAIEMSRPAADVIARYAALSPTDVGDIVDSSCVVRYDIRPLWPGCPRIAGPALTVRTAPGENLMMHAAIYLARPGDVIVCEAGDHDMAVAGGNVCKIAKRRGMAGFIIDGVIRDAGEAREAGFPVFARGVSPVPAKRGKGGEIGVPIRCGGAPVRSGDIVVADDEGIVVVSGARVSDVLAKVEARVASESKLSFDEWAARHRASVEAALRERGLRL